MDGSWVWLTGFSSMCHKLGLRSPALDDACSQVTNAGFTLQIVDVEEFLLCFFAYLASFDGFLTCRIILPCFVLAFCLALCLAFVLPLDLAPQKCAVKSSLISTTIAHFSPWIGTKDGGW